MSSELKKDLVTKTADKDIGLARASSIEESGEVLKSDEESDEGSESSETSRDNRHTGAFIVPLFVI